MRVCNTIPSYQTDINLYTHHGSMAVVTLTKILQYCICQELGNKSTTQNYEFALLLKYHFGSSSSSPSLSVEIFFLVVMILLVNAWAKGYDAYSFCILINKSLQ